MRLRAMHANRNAFHLVAGSKYSVQIEVRVWMTNEHGQLRVGCVCVCLPVVMRQDDSRGADSASFTSH